MNRQNYRWDYFKALKIFRSMNCSSHFLGFDFSEIGQNQKMKYGLKSSMRSGIVLTDLRCPWITHHQWP